MSKKPKTSSPRATPHILSLDIETFLNDEVADDRLIGSCPELLRNLMEIRGIGLIDIQAMFGVSAVAASKDIDMVLELEVWDENKVYDRTGLKEDTTEILGVPIVLQRIPVRPGRNLAIVIEVAARNLSLRRMGIVPARDLNRRLFSAKQNIREQTGGTES